MGDVIRLLHISDLHLKDRNGISDGNYLHRFYDFISANARDIPFNHIVFTGDLKNSKDYVDIGGAMSIFEHIISSANIDKNKKSCIHIIPGNHDLTRGSNDNIAIRKIRNEYDYENGAFSNSKESLSIMMERFNDFFWPFCDKFYEKDNPWLSKDYMPHSMRVDEKNAFIYINSCLTCIDNSLDGNLIIGLVYLKELFDQLSDVENVFIMSHHPIQNFATREETGLQKLILSYDNKKFYWLCGDAHSNRASSRDYIQLYQVGSLIGISSTIPDFAIYDISETMVERRVFRFLPHLNSTSSMQGGWKRVYIDPNLPSL